MKQLRNKARQTLGTSYRETHVVTSAKTSTSNDPVKTISRGVRTSPTQHLWVKCNMAHIIWVENPYIKITQ